MERCSANDRRITCRYHHRNRLGIMSVPSLRHGGLASEIMIPEVQEQQKCLGPPWLPRPCGTRTGFPKSITRQFRLQGNNLPLGRARSQPNVLWGERQRLEQVRANLSRLISKLCCQLLRYSAAPAPQGFCPFGELEANRMSFGGSANDWNRSEQTTLLGVSLEMLDIHSLEMRDIPLRVSC